jgi:hypothetical protein
MERTQVTGQTFKAQRIILDAAEYIDCNFEDCQIVITGINGLQTRNCIFTGVCELRFEGPAFRTLETLSLLHPHPTFQPVIERVIDGIRGTGIEWKS